MRLVVQIPCLNEAGQIAATLAGIPRQVPGFDEVLVLVIDDGSTDDTAAIARAAGADHVHRNPSNMGLAKTYIIGLEQSLLLGADVIVNFDADNQYPPRYIADLVAPIVAGRAELVIGARPIGTIEHFSPLKRGLQRLGSWVVRRASGQDVPDAPSGFRAVSVAAALRLYTFSSYTYTIETIIQAGRMNIPIATVPIEVNPPVRASRLMKSKRSYILRSLLTILRIGMLYYPLRIFFWLSLVLTVPGALAILRFVFFYFQGEGAGHVQSVVIGTGMFAAGIVLLIGGVLADLVSANRMLLQDIRARVLEEKIRRLRS